MPVKWDDKEQLKLLRTALLCLPDLSIGKYAKAIVQAWPVEDGEEPPTERAVKDRFNQIMKHARDLNDLHNMKKNDAIKDDSGNQKDTKMAVTTSPTTKPSPFTLVRRPLTKGQHSSTGKKSSTGSKRKRRGEEESLDDIASDAETSSGSETAVISPTPMAVRSLRVRKVRTAVPAMADDGDKEFGDGAKDYGSDYSDDEYDLAEERRKKAVKKTKEAKLAARRSLKK